MTSHTALITGASSGLGLEFAELCAEKHYDLVLCARNETKLNQIKEDLEKQYGIQVYVCPADLSKKDAALDVFAFTEEHSLSVDILINNAGYGDAGRFMERNWQKQYEMVQLNITAVMQLTYLYLKPMTERRQGKILNVSSVASFCAGPDMSVYYASKAFVRSFSEAIAEEVKDTGVTVTALCPGPTATGFEKAASLNHSVMFRFAVSAKSVAEAGIQAMEKGKVLCNPGFIPKVMNIGSHLAPRALTRKIAKKMDH